VTLRFAGPADADAIAGLHADSWRRHYRGAYADAFLDGDAEADRRQVWTARFAAPAHAQTILAERDGELVGFLHVFFDHDPRWGSLIDNLHIRHDQRRAGIGSRLLASCAEAVAAEAAGPAAYLWVLRQNEAAQAFYLASGATCVEESVVPPPGGHPDRLNGQPHCLRMAWSDLRR
jgi:ribosomal protein S18 acetylase RimI-like enzyme